jgi:hypothetical protein
MNCIRQVMSSDILHHCMLAGAIVGGISTMASCGMEHKQCIYSTSVIPDGLPGHVTDALVSLLDLLHICKCTRPALLLGKCFAQLVSIQARATCGGNYEAAVLMARIERVLSNIKAGVQSIPLIATDVCACCDTLSSIGGDIVYNVSQNMYAAVMCSQ